MHASHAFCFEHFEVFKKWHELSDYLAVLSVKNEYELMFVLEKARSLGIKCSLFKEPDIGDQVTAIALEPCAMAKKLCSSIPLALK